MFVQSERFVGAHGGRRDDVSIYGQESNPTPWRLAAMNLAFGASSAIRDRNPPTPSPGTSSPMIN